MKFKSIKAKAREMVKKHYFRNIIVVFVSLLIINGGYSYISSINDSNKNSYTIKELEKGNKSNSKLINEIVIDSAKDINKKEEIVRKKEKDISSLIINEFTSSKSFFLGFLNSVNKIIFKRNYKIISILALLLIIHITYLIFIKYPIMVGKSRYFIEKVNYENTRAEKLVFTYKIKKILHTSFSVLVKNIYLFLWGLTIIGGVIKYYSYFLVPYILAENPNIKTKDAIKLSKEMMMGYKWKLFLLQFTFIPWHILSILTFKLSNVFYFDAYREAIYSAFYMNIRKISKDKSLYNINLLNDNLLDGKATYDVYPEEEIKNRFSSYTKIDSLNYNRDYSIISLILLFFTFAFVGWIWEVTIGLVNYGKFINKGTMFGPWLPIYGFGGLFVLILLKPFRNNPILTFALAFILCGFVEYFTGWYLETFKHMKWWDYSSYVFNINGRVCLEGLIVFELGGCAFTYIFAPLIDNLYSNISPNLKLILCVILVFLFSIDLVYSHYKPNNGAGITKKVGLNNNSLKKINYS